MIRPDLLCVHSPPSDSTLLAEVAAVYAVNHRHYFDFVRRDARNNGWKPPSLKFAWHVAGDYFNLIKTRQSSESRPGARRGAAPVADQRTTTRLLAANHRTGARHSSNISA